LGGFQNVFLNDIEVFNLTNLDFYKTYNAKNLLQITRPPKGEPITFILKNNIISLNKCFFFKKIQMENEKLTFPILRDIQKTGKLNFFSDVEFNEKSMANDILNPVSFTRINPCNQIIDVSKNTHFSLKSLLLFYEISFTGKLTSYVTFNDLEDLVEIAKFFGQITIKKKLTNIIEGIKELYKKEYQNIDINHEIFNITSIQL